MMDLSIIFKIIFSIAIVGLWVFLVWIINPFKKPDEFYLSADDDAALNSSMHKKFKAPFSASNCSQKISVCRDNDEMTINYDA
jgi:hypothetical protein